MRLLTFILLICLFTFSFALKDPCSCKAFTRSKKNFCKALYEKDEQVFKKIKTLVQGDNDAETAKKTCTKKAGSDDENNCNKLVEFFGTCNPMK